VPDIGDFKDVAVIELLVKPGDTVKAEQSLITVESDKASMEIPSAAGVLKELKVKVGDKVNIGDLIAVLEGTAGAAAAPAPPRQPCTGGNRDGQCARAGCGFAAPVARPQPAAARPHHGPPAACRTRRRRCASSRANSACRWKRSRARAPRAASRRKTPGFTKP
jgi:pyruvate dehydrogenase E2 component (dihydrolipoamide acetyltransferase)